MAELLIRGGTVTDAGGSRRADVLVADGVVTNVGEGLEASPGATVLDAGGCLVSPGLVDLHTHLRQPGREEAETVETGARAAALGGYTAVVAMPNTEPAIDCAAVVQQVLDLGRAAPAEVAVAAAITVGRAGERLAPLAELAALGVRIFTDDGSGVQDGGLMRRALDYAAGLRARGFPVVLAQHCEDNQLAGGGCMHEGAWSSRLGLPGMPAAAEEAMVARDIGLCRLTGCPVHFLHLSTAGAVDLVRRAKAEGLPVTAEAAPHHIVLTDALVAAYDPVFRVNPPLRTDGDVAAVKAGLVDGTIDAIATDHAPHAPEMKDRPFDQAPPGMLGLETALAIALTELPLPPERVLALMSWQAAAIAGLGPAGGGAGLGPAGGGAGLGPAGGGAGLGPAGGGAGRGPAGSRPAGGFTVHGGPVAPGADANLCVVNPAAVWSVNADRLASRSRNTPYAGRKLTGRVRHTVLRGEPVVIDGEAQR